MAGNNPFCLSFGREPDRYVERTENYLQISEMIDSISPSNNCYLIMGVRGSGKTVLLSTIANKYRENSKWAVISLNPGRDMLEMLASGLYEEENLRNYFTKAPLNLSAFGIGINIKRNPPISDIEIAVKKMIKIVNDNGKRILITIDDITKSNEIISFAGAFQNFLSEGMEVFLIMTGLYENVYSLQTDKRCSFLLRAEKIVMKPLSLMGMKNQYRQTFQCSEKEALRMAAFTKGYSYAFQVLGYIMWDKECSLEEAVPFFDERMAEYCYEKIWDDLSAGERDIISLLAENGEMRTKDIMAKTGASPKSFSVQRDRLIKKGIIDGHERGFVDLMLPRFEEYVKLINF